MIKLDTRLKLAADEVRPGKKVVDIGTDHAYLPAFLVENGICTEAIAADIGKGPLEIRARLKEMKRNFAFIDAEISHEGKICSTCEMVYCTFSKDIARNEFFFNGCILEEEA